MLASNQADSLSWERRPVRELIRLSWPITISTLSYSMMTLVDTLLVGRLGPAQLAGIGLGGTAAFTLLCFSFGLIRGVKTLVSQAIGADRREEIGKYLGAALLAAFGIGVVTVLLGETLADAISRIEASAEAAEAARTYLRIRLLGAPLALTYVALREVRYGMGDARTPMISTILANAVNIVLAYLFVFRLHKGVAGAAWATVIAHTVEAGSQALVQHVRGWNVRGLRWSHLVELWNIGVPTGLQFALEVGAFAILAGLVAALSETQMAAHQIALQVIHFSFLPAFAVAEAASVLAGQAVGANRDDLVVRIARLGMVAAAAYTGACTVILALGAPLIVAGFNPTGELAHLASRLLYVAAIFQVFDAANIMARGVLRGTGDVRYAAVVGVVSSWLFTPPLTWLLGYRLGLGALGGWLGLLGEIVCGAILLWVRLERRAWIPSAERARERLAGFRLPASGFRLPDPERAPPGEASAEISAA
jgi:MATE family multidrug resistance protein